MPRKTIDQIRHELRLEKEKTRKLRKELAKAKTDVWLKAATVAAGVVKDYPLDIFLPPELDSSPDRYSAAGARLAAGRIAKECLRRANEI